MPKCSWEKRISTEKNRFSFYFLNFFIGFYFSTQLGVDSFGLSVTTLEDVFLKVGAAENDENMEV